MILKRYFSVIIFILFGLLIFLTTKFVYQNKIDEIQLEKQSCTNELTNISIPTITFENVELVSQKNQIITDLEKSLLFFSSKVYKLSSNRWQITVKLEGPDYAGADAVDLYLNFDKKIKIDEILTGKAFPLYPRKIIAENYLLVSGVASIDENKISFGQPDNTFITFIVSTDTPETDSYKIPLKLNANMEETRIYFNGETVFDKDKTFKEILLD